MPSETPSIEFGTCPRCRGSGESRSGGGGGCLACGTRGRLRIVRVVPGDREFNSGSIATCPRCHGLHGRGLGGCRTCFSTGHVIEELAEHVTEVLAEQPAPTPPRANRDNWPIDAHECPRCHGSGDAGTLRAGCVACESTGWIPAVYVTGPIANQTIIQICPACRGSGVDCRICRGRGNVLEVWEGQAGTVEAPPAPAPAERDSEPRYRPCRRCNGTGRGRIVPRGVNDPIRHFPVYDDCPDCQGTGEIVYDELTGERAGVAAVNLINHILGGDLPPGFLESAGTMPRMTRTPSTPAAGDGITRRRELSEDGVYLYRNSRIWDATNPPTLFILLHPVPQSGTFDAVGIEDDPTTLQVMARAREAGAGGVEIVHLFARRVEDATALLQGTIDPIGPDNGDFILDAADECERVVCAWGNVADAVLAARAADVAEMLTGIGKRLTCLGFNDTGTPIHPAHTVSRTLANYPANQAPAGETIRPRRRRRTPAPQSAGATDAGITDEAGPGLATYAGGTDTMSAPSLVEAGGSRSGMETAAERIAPDEARRRLRAEVLPTTAARAARVLESRRARAERQPARLDANGRALG